MVTNIYKAFKKIYIILKYIKKKSPLIIIINVR